MKQFLLALALLAAAAAPAGAQTHAYKTAEVIRRETKTCYYEATGNVYTRLVGRSNPCPLSIPLASPLPRPRPTLRPYLVTPYKIRLTTGQTQRLYGYVRIPHLYRPYPLSIRVRR